MERPPHTHLADWVKRLALVVHARVVPANLDEPILGNGVDRRRAPFRGDGDHGFDNVAILKHLHGYTDRGPSPDPYWYPPPRALKCGVARQERPEGKRGRDISVIPLMLLPCCHSCLYSSLLGTPPFATHVEVVHVL